MSEIIVQKISVPYFGKARDVRIYLPKKYHEDAGVRFPVLYMLDAQNIFDPELAFGGQSWEVHNSLAELEAQGHRGIIVVGIDNAGEHRADEYSPWPASTDDGTLHKIFGHYFDHQGGKGEQFAQLLVRELKPAIDKQYRTLVGPEHTAIAGSSMGGFISAYTKIKYPEVFSAAGIFSIASWFARPEFNNFILNAHYFSEQKYFIHSGTHEGSDREGNKYMRQIYIDCAIDLQRMLLQKGVNINEINFAIHAGETHNEKYWAKHFIEFVKWVF